MAKHPFQDVAIVGIHNTAQARVLEGHDTRTITMEAALGALADAGLSPRDVDGVVGGDLRRLRLPDPLAVRCGGPCRRSASRAVSRRPGPSPTAWPPPSSSAPAGPGSTPSGRPRRRGPGRRTSSSWPTACSPRPSSPSSPAGTCTPTARRPKSLATVAATIRNNGHVNPEAVYYGRGPYTPEDILDSRMVADPFHLLDCAMTAEGGCGPGPDHAPSGPGTWPSSRSSCSAATPTTSDRPTSTRRAFELGGNRRPDLVNGWTGRRAAEDAFRHVRPRPDDVDVCEFYDPFSFEIIRQFEAFGFCNEGEGGRLRAGRHHRAEAAAIRSPPTAALMSFSHGGATVQLLQRVIRGVQQVRQRVPAPPRSRAPRWPCAQAAGPGALFTDVMLIGADQP